MHFANDTKKHELFNKIEQLQVSTADYFQYQNLVKMVSCDRSQNSNQILASPNFQSGDSRNNKKSGYKREWLVLIDLKDTYFYKLIHKESQHLV